MPKVTNADRLLEISEAIDEVSEGIPTAEYIELLDDIAQDVRERRAAALDDEARKRG